VLLLLEIAPADAVPVPPKPLSPGAQMLKNRTEKTSPSAQARRA
jgi:hypothetical protein